MGKSGNKGSLILGCVLLLLPVIAVSVDAKNNWDFASAISVQAGLVAVACAVGLSVLPGVLAMREWPRSIRWMLLSVIAVCGVATVFAAANAYLTRQGHAMAAGKAQQQAYDNNQAALAAMTQTAATARVEAARITETASIDELKLLLKEAEEKAQREAARVRCAERCEAAKGEYARIVERLGQAKAKSAALARAENAEKRVEELGLIKQTPVQQNIMAAKIAGMVKGANVHDVEEWVAIVLDTLWITATLLFAPLAYPAILLIRQGIGVEAVEIPGSVVLKSREIVKTLPKIPSLKATPVTVTKTIAARAASNSDELLNHFFDECIDRDGEMTSDMLYTALQRWCGQQRARNVPGRRQLATYMASRGVGSVKRGGRMVYPVCVASNCSAQYIN